MERVRASTEPAGFAFQWDRDQQWLPHAVPGIKVRKLALNKARRYGSRRVVDRRRLPGHPCRAT
jgi:hypothetical protein